MRIIMNLEHKGNALTVEVNKVTNDGVWLCIDNKPHLLDFINYPWFLHAPACKIFLVEQLGYEGISWVDLDIDLSIDSIFDPSLQPIKARIQ